MTGTDVCHWLSPDVFVNRSRFQQVIRLCSVPLEGGLSRPPGYCLGKQILLLNYKSAGGHFDVLVPRWETLESHANKCRHHLEKGDPEHHLHCLSI